jgi:hypothetical protein
VNLSYALLCFWSFCALSVTMGMNLWFAACRFSACFLNTVTVFGLTLLSCNCKYWRHARYSVKQILPSTTTFHIFNVTYKLRNNKQQLMQQNTYNLYSYKSPTCFDPAGPSSGRIVLIHYGCVYTCQARPWPDLTWPSLAWPAVHTQTADSTRYLSNGGWNLRHIHT